VAGDSGNGGEKISLFVVLSLTAMHSKLAAWLTGDKSIA
jgi:hypothetical protein